LTVNRGFTGFRVGKKGVSGANYALLVAGVAVIVISAVIAIGDSIGSMMNSAGDRMETAVPVQDGEGSGSGSGEGSGEGEGEGEGEESGGTPALQAASASQTVHQDSIPGACASVQFSNPGDGDAAGVASVIAGDYTTTGCSASSCAGSLPAGQTCQVHVRGAGTADGQSLSGSVTVTADGGLSVETTLSGSVNSPMLTASSPQAVNQIGFPAGACVPVTFQNTGTGTLQFAGSPVIETAGDYEHGPCSVSCFSNVNEGYTCTVSVRGAASAAGPLSGSITLTSQNGGSATVSLSGYATEGAMLGWGGNQYGQIGDGSSGAVKLLPVAVRKNASEDMGGAVDISSGSYVSCAALADGSAWCWGITHIWGLLGNGTIGNTDPVYPVQVHNSDNSGFLSDIVQVSTANTSSCARTSGGNLWCWGSGNQGQLGNGNVSSPNYPSPVQVLAAAATPFSGVVEVSGGGNAFNCARDGSGHAWCWGYNANGRLGNNSTSASGYPVQVRDTTGGAGTMLSYVTAISAGADHVCAVAGTAGNPSAGNVYCWGSGTQGQLGNGSTAESRFPVAVRDDTGGAGTTLSGITSIASGGSHTCAIGGGGVWCWGYDSFGQLGNGAPNGAVTYPQRVLQYSGGSGTYLSGITRIAAGGSGSCALGTGGAVYCWGQNGFLGANSGTSVSSPVETKAPGGTVPLTGITALGGGPSTDRIFAIR
jgi:alpha-tubulin suppressor-like RCC1 family protein/Flp pilus assembly pilin Flp